MLSTIFLSVCLADVDSLLIPFIVTCMNMTWYLTLICIPRNTHNGELLEVVLCLFFIDTLPHIVCIALLFNPPFSLNCFSSGSILKSQA